MRRNHLLHKSGFAGKEVDRLLAGLVAKRNLRSMGTRDSAMRSGTYTLSTMSPPSPPSDPPPSFVQQPPPARSALSPPSPPPPPPPPAAVPISFCVQLMQEKPSVFFDQILSRWAMVMEASAVNPSSVAADILRSTNLREAQLLNSKLHQAEFHHPKPKWTDTRTPSHEPPTSHREVGDEQDAGYMDQEEDDERALAALLGDAEMVDERETAVGTSMSDSVTPNLPSMLTKSASMALGLEGTARPMAAAGPSGLGTPKGIMQLSRPVNSPAEGGLPRAPPRHNLFRYYSFAHFVAELDSPELFHFAMENLPLGVPVYRRPDAPPTTNLPFHSPGAHSRRARCSGFPSVETIAREYPDHEGYYLIHRAAMSDATESLAFLVDAFGSADMFRLQRAVPLLQYSVLPGVLPHHARETATGAAIAVGATKTLAWLLAHHPTELQLRPEALSLALVAAAAADAAPSFTFLADHRQLPLNTSESVADALLLEGLPTVLRECGCHTALYAAAAAGSEDVLDWYVRTFGEEVLWVRDSAGATALHYCAQGGHVGLLRALLVDRRVADCPNAARHVDDVDESGRTPAMWCVQGRCKGRHVTDTLALLESVGSHWRHQRDGHGDTVAEMAARVHRPFTKVMRFVAGRRSVHT